MFLGNRSIRYRLAVVLGAMLALVVAGSVFALMKLQQLGVEINHMVEDNVKIERAGADWMRNTVAGIQRASAIAKSSDASLVAYFAPFTAEAVKQANVLQSFIESKIQTPQEREVFDKVAKLRARYLASREQVSKLKAAGDVDGASSFFTATFEPTAREYVAGMQEMIDAQRAELDAATVRTQELRAQARMVLYSSALLTLCIGAVLAFWLARSITQPLQRAERIASEIAAMDLTGSAQDAYASDETGSLLRALDAMRRALQQSLAQVRGVVDGVSTASAEIAGGNRDLSARTEQAASNLEETASSMEELTGTVRQSADSAKLASQLAASAAQVARDGGQVVSRVVASMEEISTSSRKIADIIDGIAFQTNILALNAAVEAARAGEQGRGFAVVAGEVRTLAQRSAQAAKEIKALIVASAGSVETGSGHVQAAGTTMAEIVSNVNRVADIIGEISAAANEQSQGIAQVNAAVNQLDHMTQQNAALVEESTAAADQLRDQAETLARTLSRFRLPGA